MIFHCYVSSPEGKQQDQECEPREKVVYPQMGYGVFHSHGGSPSELRMVNFPWENPKQKWIQSTYY